MKLHFLLPLLLIASCTSTWQTRFHAEYNWHKDIYRTPIGIQVAPPTWLAEEDIPVLLEYVDKQVKWLVRAYPWAKNFDFGQYVVWVHESPNAFIAGTPAEHAWARGWAIGKYLVVAWGLERDDYGRPNGPSLHSLLPALTHEWMHMILQAQYGYADPGHMMYFQSSEVRCAIDLPIMNAALGDPVELSEATIKAYRAYRYMPWLIMG